MEAKELRELGRQIARGIATGLMAATAAGAAEFCREMEAARADANADSVSALADRLEQENHLLRQEITAASGLKCLALEQLLHGGLDLLQPLCEEVLAQTLSLPAPAQPQPAVLPGTKVALSNLARNDLGVGR